MTTILFLSLITSVAPSDFNRLVIQPFGGTYVLKGVACKYGELKKQSPQNAKALAWQKAIDEENKISPLSAVVDLKNNRLFQEDFFANLSTHLESDADCRMTSTANVRFLDKGKLDIKTNDWAFAGICSNWSYQEMCARTLASEWTDAKLDMCDNQDQYAIEMDDRCKDLNPLLPNGQFKQFGGVSPVFKRSKYREIFSEYVWNPAKKTLRLVLNDQIGECENTDETPLRDPNRNHLSLEFERVGF